MGKYQFEDTDKNGQRIDQRPKDSHSVEVDGRNRFCGHRFVLKTKLFGDKRCIYCGKWFHWKDTDYISWVRGNNIDRNNFDNIPEPLHCGSLHCQEYHHLVRKEKERRVEIILGGEMARLFRDISAQCFPNG